MTQRPFLPSVDGTASTPRRQTLIHGMTAGAVKG